MSKGIISSFNSFKEMFSEEDFFDENSARINALIHYFNQGGVISIKKNKGKWPKLIYPSIARIKEQKKEQEKLKNKLESKKNNLLKIKKNAENYHLVHNIKKFSNPLFWKHTAKYLTDKEYKNDSDLVKLPAHLVCDSKWKPMVKMFVNDVEYRKQLTETVENSIIYKNNKKVAGNADARLDFRKEFSSKEITLLSTKLNSIQSFINSLNILEKWAKE